MSLDDLTDAELDALIEMKSKAAPKPEKPDFTALIEAASSKHGVPKEVLNAVIKQESAFNPKAVSSAGAQGLMQLMPATAKDLGVADSFDPEQNVDAGTRYLAQQYKTFGSWPLAFAAYNAGPGNVRKHGGVPPFKETQGYVKNIVANLGDFLASPASAAAPNSPEDPLDTLSDEELDALIALKTPPEVPTEEAKPAEEPFLNQLINRQKSMGMDERAIQGLGAVFPPLAPLVGLPRKERGEVTGALSKFGKGASAGLIDPTAAFISSALTGKEYSDLRDEQKVAADKFSEENPYASMGLEVAGLFAPGGMLSRSIGAGEKIAGKVLPGALEKGAPFLKNLLARLVRGGSSAGIFGAVNPETPLDDLPKEIALGATIDPALGVVGKGLKGVGKGLEYGKDFAWKTAKKLPVVGAPLEAAEEIIKKVKTEKVVDALDDIARAGGADDVITAGEGFASKVDDINQQIFDKYKAVKDPLLSKYGGAKASVERVRKSIVDSLDEAGVVDAKGNIDFDSPLFAGPEGANFKALTKLLDRLQQNPTVAEMDRLLRGIGKKANFKGANRTYADQAFGKIYGEGVEGLLDNLDEILVKTGERSRPIAEAKRAIQGLKEKRISLGEEAKAPLKGQRHLEEIAKSDEALAQTQGVKEGELGSMLDANRQAAQSKIEEFRSARKEFSEQRPFVERLVKHGSKDPEKVIKGAKSQLTGSFIQDAITANPAFREPLKQAVLADLASSVKDQRTLKKALDTYGEKPLKMLFGDEFQAIEKLTREPERFLKNFVSRLSSRAGQSNSGSPLSKPGAASVPAYNFMAREAN